MFNHYSGEYNSQKKKRRLPSLVALRCFEAAARQENFTRAAEELHLTHGAISRAVRLLEDELEIQLFHRRQRRVFLTEEGKLLADAVRQGFSIIEQVIYTLHRNNQASRQWVLSCEPTLLMRWLIPRWSDFTSKHPEIQIHLVAGGGAVSFAEGVDMAIRRNDFNWPTHYHTELLFPEWIGPVCRPEKQQEWFTSSGIHKYAPRLHSQTRPYGWERWYSITRQAESDNYGDSFEHFYFTLQAAIAGMGIAMAPRVLVEDDLVNGLLVAPLGFVEEGASYCLLTPESPSSESPQAHLLKWLREKISESHYQNEY